jgi:hypothetical protein
MGGAEASASDKWKLAIAAGGAALLAALAASYFVAASGDEPPIRVKGGSIYLELIHDSKSWREDGSKKKWKLSGGTRKSNKLAVYLAPKNPAHCTTTFAGADYVSFVYSDGVTIELRAVNKKTKVTSSADLEEVNEQLLEYPAAGGFIDVIKVDGDEVCNFSEPNQLHGVLITE